MMDTKKLRQKVLDLAIRGKLVPQDPNDEPASVLLQRIQEEKERLIKEGKIKRDKKEKTSDASHYENLPFEIPESWVWVSIGNLCSSLQYGTSEKSLIEGKVAVLRMGNISHVGELNYDDLVFTSNDGDIAKYTLISRDLLFNRTNSSEWVGKTAIYRGEIPAIFAGYIIRFRPIFLNLEYVNYVMNSNYEKEYCQSVKTDGVNQSNINSQKLAKFLIPIPPLQEQERIVSVIESSFALIDEIESNKLSLAQFIKQAKSKVLDLAIRGKLVTQNPNDEPTSLFLERIRNEQKTKKQPSDTSHYPFEVPEGWLWCRLNDICSQITDGTHRTPNYTENGVPFLRVTDITESNASKRFISEQEHKELVKRCKPEKGDVLLSKNGTIGVTKVVDWDYDFSIFVSLCLLKPESIILNSKYLAFYLSSNEAMRQIKSRGKTFTITNLHLEEIKQLQVLIPPLTEQHRIVSKIEQIFTQLDEIEKAIKA